MSSSTSQSPRSWRHVLHEVIFEADTFGGKLFDVALLISILLSVVVVMLDSVAAVSNRFGTVLICIEWGLTILFTLEYFLRLLCVQRPSRYALSFFGIVDLLAIIPTYLSVLFSGSQSLMVIRVLRLLRIFRVFKLPRYIGEAHALLKALRATQVRIAVFLLFVLAVVLIMGSTMYLVEGPENGFTSIPKSVYWAIVTMTTVGYGDIAPKTVPGQFIAALSMILGYSIIIVPIGIFSVELFTLPKQEPTTQSCPHCLKEGHDSDAGFCKYCGHGL